MMRMVEEKEESGEGEEDEGEVKEEEGSRRGEDILGIVATFPWSRALTRHRSSVVMRSQGSCRNLLVVILDAMPLFGFCDVIYPKPTHINRNSTMYEKSSILLARTGIWLISSVASVTLF